MYACCTALPAVPTPERMLKDGDMVAKLAATLKDLWQLARNRQSVLAFILCFLPIGTGAVVFSSIASEWRASADTVSLITGVLAGIISAVGCIVGGWGCDRMNRQQAYVLFGLFQACSGWQWPCCRTLSPCLSSGYRFTILRLAWRMRLSRRLCWKSLARARRPPSTTSWPRCPMCPSGTDHH